MGSGLLPDPSQWVYCAGGGNATDNRCFSFDIHKHSQGVRPPSPLPAPAHAAAQECWLKRQADPSEPTVGDSGEYPPEMRAAPRAAWPWAVTEELWPWAMPQFVHWTSGVLLPGGALQASRPHEPGNFRRWCDANGCAGMPKTPALAVARRALGLGEWSVA